MSGETYIYAIHIVPRVVEPTILERFRAPFLS